MLANILLILLLERSLRMIFMSEGYAIRQVLASIGCPVNTQPEGMDARQARRTLEDCKGSVNK
jgi:hypothetical protein